MILISGRVSLLKSIHKIMNIFLRAYGAKQTLFGESLFPFKGCIEPTASRHII